MGCVTLFWWKRQTWGRPLLFALGYFVTMLFPVLGFFDQGFYTYSLVADHWQYYSVIGIIALVVAAGVTLCRDSGSLRRHIGTVTGAVVLVVLGTSTWIRASVYGDAETLWRDTLAKNPNAWVAHNNLGIALKDQGKVQEAVGQYEQALRINPNYADAHYNLGSLCYRQAESRKPSPTTSRPCGSSPTTPRRTTIWGWLWRKRARSRKPSPTTSRPCVSNPIAPRRTTIWGRFAQTGKIEEAIAHYEQALRIKPDDAEAHNNLAVALLQTGRINEAIAQFEQALQLKPDYAEAHVNLAVALENTGRRREAVDHYQQALKLQPDLARASNALARLRTGQ